MDDNLRRKQQQVVIKGTAAAGKPVTDTTERVWDHDEEQRTKILVSLSFCASCRAVVRGENVGGVCAVCNSVVCAECARKKCAICGSIVCDNGECSARDGESVICGSHGFLACFLHAFSRRK